MVYTYDECLNMYGSPYQIKKQVEKGTLYLIQKGLYSDIKNENELLVISKKYPDAVFTMNSAFYYYGLTDTIPDYYYLATFRNNSKIRDNRIKQIFENNDYLNIGITQLNYNGVNLKIYSRERLLAELIRRKSLLPYDYYKEIIGSYRKVVSCLDIQELQEIVIFLPKSNYIMEILQAEVF